MNRPVRMAAWLALAWTRFYTAGIDEQTRSARRAEIESDIWEQANDADASREVAGALSMLKRCLAGVPADVAWRCQVARRGGRLSRRLDVIEMPATSLERPDLRPVMPILAGAAWAMVVSNLASPAPHSLVFAGAALAGLALAGWALEARSEAEGASASSYWPLVLAVSVSVIGAGMVIPWGYAGTFVSLPLAAALTLAWLAEPGSARLAPTRTAIPAGGDVLARRRAQGDAIAIEMTPDRTVSRRALLRTGIWVGLGSALAATLGLIADYLWERKPPAFGGLVVAGPVDRFSAGSKTHVLEGKFWLVHLTEEQGGPGFLALWHKCPHLGCTVPWDENFRYTDVETGRSARGWFRCPCHQSTYDHAGVRVAGPAPRSMDRMQLRIDPETRRIEVDTGRISKGEPDNARFAVPIPPLT